MPADEKRGRLIIVCGLPCAGKTTHAKALEARLPAFRCCPDEWMEAIGINLWEEHTRAKIEALQWQMAQQLLWLGVNVIIEWGTWGRSERDVLREGARALGAAVELHYLDAPVDVLFERAQRRRLEDPPMTRDDLQKWSDAFQRPTAKETALFDEPLISDLAVNQ
jgi:predicted kinase